MSLVNNNQTYIINDSSSGNNVLIMDPERQPLLADVRCRRVRALTFEEVLAVRQNSIWRRSRLILILIFWATIAMFLSMIACLLLKSRCGPELSSVEGVPPVHLTLAPLIASVRDDSYMRNRRCNRAITSLGVIETSVPRYVGATRERRRSSKRRMSICAEQQQDNSTIDQSTLESNATANNMTIAELSMNVLASLLDSKLTDIKRDLIKIDSKIETKKQERDEQLIH